MMAKAHLALSHALVACSKGNKIEKMQAVNYYGFQYYTHFARPQCERNIIHTADQLSRQLSLGSRM